jgi:hypothetical protein
MSRSACAAGTWSSLPVKTTRIRSRRAACVERNYDDAAMRNGENRVHDSGGF